MALVALTQVDAEYLQHCTGRLEDLVTRSDRVIFDVVPWEFCQQRDERFICALWGAQCEIRLLSISAPCKFKPAIPLNFTHTVRLLGMSD